MQEKTEGGGWPRERGKSGREEKYRKNGKGKK